MEKATRESWEKHKSLSVLKELS